MALVLGAQADELPKEFAVDRGRLYFGPNHDLQALKRDLPHILAQLRAQLGWVDQRLAGGRAFMLGEAPGLPDALCYHPVWFIRGRYAGGPALLEQFPALLAWEERVRAIGHGSPSELSAAEALEIALTSRATTAVQPDVADPQHLAPGMTVGVTPEGIGGDPAVVGQIVSVSVEEIALRCRDPRIEEVVVHFPRVGYRVSPQAGRTP